MKTQNVVIVGAGPIGCYAGYLLAKEGHSVEIFENHAQIGSPIQCTGILTSDFDQFGFPLESFLVNTIDTIEVFSPRERISVKQKDYIVCRTKFDNFFGDMAKKAGCVVYVNHSFMGLDGEKLLIKNSQTGDVIVKEADLVIAADGPLSPTAKAFGIFEPSRENYYGVQAVVEGKFEKGTIKTYFGEKVCPGLFAWVCPESETVARVGLACKKNSKKYFDDFMQEHGFVAKEMQAGTISIYNPKQILQKGRCYVVGDASSYVKATTLGGLVPALRQVEILVDCLKKGEDYTTEIAPVRRKMWLHLKLHKVFEKMKDDDWDRLLRYIKRSGVEKVLETHTRDNPFPIVTKALLKEPRFFYFLKYLV